MLEYAPCPWDPLPKTLSTQVKAVQRRSARVVFNNPCVSRKSATALLRKLNWAPLEKRRNHRRICLFRAMHFAEVNAPFFDFVAPNKQTGTRRDNLQYRIEHHKTKAHMLTFFICTSKDWNKLDPQDRLLPTWLVHYTSPWITGTRPVIKYGMSHYESLQRPEVVVITSGSTTK